ncbi:MAG: 50S ribosomal protein L29 [Gemmataceae bacterium]
MKRKEKLSEYRGANAEQLQLSLNELEKNLFHLRFQSATDRLETPSEIRKAKRDIARILTIRSEKAKKEQTNG